MKYIIFLSLSILFVLTSCGDDADCTEAGVDQEQANFNTSLDLLISTYNTDPSEDNCKKLKEESEEFIEFLEGLRTCADIDQNSLESAISQAESNLINIPC